MTYDNWKCTDPNDQWLGDPIDAAFMRYHDGEISLAELGEIVMESGRSPRETRLMLTEAARYPIPKGYFGKEEEWPTENAAKAFGPKWREIENRTFDEAGSSDKAFDHFSRQK